MLSWIDLRPSVPENPQSAHGKTGRIQQGILECGYAPARSCVEVSLQVEEDKRTVASGAARVTGIKAIQRTKHRDGRFNLFKVFVKFPHTLLSVFPSPENWSHQQQVREITWLTCPKSETCELAYSKRLLPNLNWGQLFERDKVLNSQGCAVREKQTLTRE